MSKLTDELIQAMYDECDKKSDGGNEFMLMFARAIEAAATEPLLQRIAELEKALKLVQQHHATAWNRGHIAGMAANRMVAQDALNAVKKDAWNNTQLTEALMAAEARCEELEQRNRDLYEDVQRFKEHALNEKAARMELEHQLEEARKDAERLDWMIFYSASLNHGNDGEYCRVVWMDHELGEQATRLFGDSREAIDAAMQKGQS